MFTLLFLLCSIAVFWKLLVFAIKASWGLTKMLTSFILFPVLLLILLIRGLIAVAFPLLIIVGVFAFLSKKN